MKLFYRQFLFLLILVLTVFVGAAYLTFFRAGTSINDLLEKNALLQTKAVKGIIEANLKGEVLTNDVFSDSLQDVISQSLQSDLTEFSYIKKLSLVALPKGQSLLKIAGNGFSAHDSVEMQALHEIAGETAISLIPDDEYGYTAFFQLKEQINIGAVMEITPDETVPDQIHTLTVHFYLLGFGGVLLALLLAMLSARFIKLPLAQIDKAFDNIEKRKFSHRIRLSKNHEFYELYEKINRAMNQLHQLDASQRAAANARNTALKDMRTFSRYLDIMAHEIKNPLHAMGINLDVLKTKIQQQKPKADTLKHTRILEREVDHLQQVIQGFLTYARPGVPRKGRAKLNQMVKEVCQMVRSEADKSKVKIETRLARNLRDLKIDREQFKRALHNIVVNAIHASKEQSKIVIRTSSNRRQLQISVKDNGEGIRKEEVRKIFDLYYTTKENGTGLGLPVTKRLIEANGGQISLNSKPGQGTMVTITLQSI